MPPAAGNVSYNQRYAVAGFEMTLCKVVYGACEILHAVVYVKETVQSAGLADEGYKVRDPLFKIKPFTSLYRGHWSLQT